jgi:class 3 adenylate cyclase
VEQATRETGDVVLLTEATRCLLSGGGPDLEPRDALPLKGIAEPVPVYAPAARRGAPAERATTAI